VEIVANSQDMVTAKTNEIAYSDYKLKYRNVAKTFERIGISEVAEMINRAKVVATVNCLQEWKAVLGTWRQLHQEGSCLFATVGLTRYDIAEDTTARAEDTTAGLSDDTDTVPDTQNNQLVLS